jgi:hypothetical protein
MSSLFDYLDTFQTWIDQRSAKSPISGEAHTILSASPYTIRLVERPDETVQVAISGTPPGGGGSYTEQSSLPTASGEFYVDYNTGLVYFYSTDAGGSVTAAYSGWGSVVMAEEQNAVQDMLTALFAPEETLGETLVAGDVVCRRKVAGNNRVYAAKNDDIVLVHAIGILQTGGDAADTSNVALFGPVEVSSWFFSDAAIGLPVYLSDTAGELTTERPDIIANPDQAIVEVGRIESNDTIFVNPRVVMLGSEMEV